jgi:hypothetical protein
MMQRNAWIQHVHAVGFRASLDLLPDLPVCSPLLESQITAWEPFFPKT